MASGIQNQGRTHNNKQKYLQTVRHIIVRGGIYYSSCLIGRSENNHREVDHVNKFLRVVICGLSLGNSVAGPISFAKSRCSFEPRLHAGKLMPEFKLISADSHVNEPPAAWKRVQQEYGERAPKVVKDPPGVPRGIWLLIDGLPPVGLSHYSKGQAVGKDKGISEVEQEKHFETIRFNEQFRYED